MEDISFRAACPLLPGAERQRSKDYAALCDSRNMPVWRFALPVLRNCVVASLLGPSGAHRIWGAGGLWCGRASSFHCAIRYASAFPLAFFAPRVVRWIGTPGPKLTLAQSAAFLTSAAVGSFVAGMLLLAIHLSSSEPFWTVCGLMLRVTAALAVAFGLASHVYDQLTAQLRETRIQAVRLAARELRKFHVFSAEQGIDERTLRWNVAHL
jgi:hypothetical protein